ncbi:MAG TPA: DNA primase [Spirochaetia bacterium]|nr:DNA primase [Spirochaetales bacterium]HRY80697.1 DNA primase [Spirochaetia bacterium]
MKRIRKDSLDTVLGRTDLVAVIGDYVRLQRSGSGYKGLCPFHNEKTPSFNVVPEKGLFYCFGCQKGGDVIAFLREIEGLSFVEAVERLAEKSGVQLEYEGSDGSPDDGARESRERDSLYELYERLTSAFQWLLREHPSGKAAREYLARRKVSRETLDSFRLGYAPRDRRWLFEFLRKKGYSPEFLAGTGLFSRDRPDRAFFADRVIFPITDYRGRSVAFGGRILEGDGPKYLNSPESRIFHKQDNLFALSAAAKAIRQDRTALICEGYMDVLAFHQAGIGYAVAPLGTAFTDGQARLLRRYADQAVFCFDSDEAGGRATEKALMTAARNGLRAKILVLEGGKDPAEILETRGGEELKKLSTFTINGDDFVVRRARTARDTTTAEGKALALKSLFPYMSALDSEIRLAEFADFAAREFRSKTDRVLADFEKFRSSGGRETGASGPESRVPALRPTSDLAFLAAAALNPGQFAAVRSRMEAADLDDEASRELFLALEECFRNDETDLDDLLARVSNPGLRNFLMEKAANGEYAIQVDRLIRDGILNVRERSLERRRSRLVRQIAQYDTDREADSVSVNDLLYEKMFIDQELEKIKEERNERS